MVTWLWYHLGVLADPNGRVFFVRSPIVAGNRPAMIPYRQLGASSAVGSRQDKGIVAGLLAFLNHGRGNVMPLGTQTTYRQVAFRSKTEAVWAQHFDKIGIPWVYEPVTFRSGGARYTPDFQLDNLPIFVEIKAAIGPLNRGAHLVYQDSKFTRPSCGHPLILICGLPKGHFAELFHLWPGPGGLYVKYASFDHAFHAARQLIIGRIG